MEGRQGGWRGGRAGGGEAGRVEGRQGGWRGGRAGGGEAGRMEGRQGGWRGGRAGGGEAGRVEGRQGGWRGGRAGGGEAGRVEGRQGGWRGGRAGGGEAGRVEGRQGGSRGGRAGRGEAVGGGRKGLKNVCMIFNFSIIYNYTCKAKLSSLYFTMQLSSGYHSSEQKLTKTRNCNISTKTAPPIILTTQKLNRASAKILISLGTE